MGKKITVFAFMALCLIFFLVAGKYVHDSGLLRKYPKATYFSETEAASRPVYEQLNDKEKALYHALYKGMTEKNGKIALPYEISGETYTKIYCLVEKQEPSLFYADSTYYTAKKLRDAKIIYRESTARIPEMEAKFNNAVRLANANVVGAKDDYTKALRIHDYLVNKCSYTIGDDQPYSSTAYGCLVLGEANCEGYAKAFMKLATENGMKCILVTGVTDEGENHAWNQVCINGEWRNVDVTWDDIDVAGDKRRMYFLCGDDEFGRTHTADSTYFKPFECNNAGNDYYKLTGSYAESAAAAEQIVRLGVRNQQKTIEVKFSTPEVYAKFREIYLENGKIFDVIRQELPLNSENSILTVRENEKESCITLIFDSN